MVEHLLKEIMSKIPDTKSTKYNKTDPFRWVDSQWEKFMTEQKELKFSISELEHHSGVAEDYITELEEENKQLKLENDFYKKIKKENLL